MSFFFVTLDSNETLHSLSVLHNDWHVTGTYMLDGRKERRKEEEREGRKKEEGRRKGRWEVGKERTQEEMEERKNGALFPQLIIPL